MLVARRLPCVVIPVLIVMTSHNAHATAWNQEQISLIGRGAPLVEKLTSEVQCGTVTYRISWRNRATSASDEFSFAVNGRIVRDQGTRSIEEFMRGARTVRLATVTCERGHEFIDFALKGLRLRREPGEKDDIIRFFRLGLPDRKSN